ncbi:MAG: radical SAM protein [Candidatus Omnitrophota bacterium]|nr:radical SAM protein [Candidatus Omnitrophota bacterium]
MKVILVNPCSTHVQDSSRYRSFVLPLLPLGVAYIAAVLERNGIEVKIIDQHADKIDDELLIQKILAESPQAVGFSCLTLVMDKVINIIRKIRALRKDIKIILGNIHPTVFADELLKENIGDVIVRGEGEHATLDTILAFRDGRDLKDIKGISFVQDGRVCRNPDRQPIEDLDKLPYPAWHLFDLGYYKKGCPLVSMYDTIIPLVASRGCPWKCIFCSQDMFYKRPRYRKTLNIVDEIEYMHKTYKVNFFGFNDANFPFSVNQGLEFCNEIIRRKLNKKIKWITETRVDLVNLELLIKMKEAGAHLIMYGFEVGNQKVLDSLKKGTTLEQARKAMKATKKAGLLTLGLFMLGVPGDTKETCEETIKFAKELDCDIVKFNIAIPLPGSAFFEEYKNKLKDIYEYKKFTSWTDWSNDKGDLLYMPETMSSQDLVNLQRKAMFTFYVRPRIIFRHILKRTISFKNLYYGAFILISNYLEAAMSRFFAFKNKKNRSLNNKL